MLSTSSNEAEGDDYEAPAPSMEELEAAGLIEPTTKGAAKQASMLDDSEGTYGSGH